MLFKTPFNDEQYYESEDYGGQDFSGVYRSYGFFAIKTFTGISNLPTLLVISRTKDLPVVRDLV
jgi:hypothetical protein